jgi:hypothetical protein
MAGFKSESRPASNRNTRPDCVGIRNLAKKAVEGLPPDMQEEFLRRWQKLKATQSQRTIKLDHAKD